MLLEPTCDLMAAWCPRRPYARSVILAAEDLRKMSLGQDGVPVRAVALEKRSAYVSNLRPEMGRGRAAIHAALEVSASNCIH